MLKNTDNDDIVMDARNLDEICSGITKIHFTLKDHFDISFQK